MSDCFHPVARPAGPFEQLIQIPGPNPILREGADEDWDASMIECCNVFKDGETYYLYYHGIPKDKQRWGEGSYRLGVATAPHPLGPWTKYDDRPVLDVGPKGSWEDRCVACAAVLKEKEDMYYMWYYASQEREGRVPRSVGLATASSPLGPWTKYEGNPILEDSGYVGGVVKVRGRYYLYCEHPIGFNSPDQGPMALAIADKPEGPWKKYEGNPVIPAGEWGDWDDGGFSEAGVVHRDGVFHMFYGGTKWCKLESIGYAYSLDGFAWHKSPLNPVGPREMNPDASAFAEVHALFEPPFIYVYHTLRYISRPRCEDIGVQVFATRRPFRLSMPVLRADIPPGGSTSLDACAPIALDHVRSLALTVRADYDSNANAGLRLCVKSSCDGLVYDTEDLFSFDGGFEAGQTSQFTTEVPCVSRFAKVVAQNLDSAHPAANVQVTATLAG